MKTAMLSRTTITAAAAAVAAITMGPGKAMAYLGSFDAPDGYWFQIGAWCDVSNYNAGQYGPNAGNGVGPTMAIPNSGLWKCQSQVGDFFPTSAARSAAFASAPPYPGPVSGTVPAYVIGNHFNGRTGNALAVRNASPAGTGTMRYDYALDSYDFGGITPSTVTSGPVDTSFWYLANDPDQHTQPVQEKFIMSFTDSGGNVGLQWGYGRDNQVMWRAGSSGPWNMPSLFGDNVLYDGVDVKIDLSSQTFGINYFDTSTSTNITLAALGTPLGASMTDLTHLGWSMVDNVTVGTFGGKNFFDDFTFKAIPEPADTGLLALSALALLRRRRRRNTSEQSGN